MKPLLLLFGLLLACRATALPPAPSIPPDLVVSADGSGRFTTIQAALESVPADNRERLVVFIKDGTYREKVRIDARYITLRGQSRDGTRIEFPQGREEFNQQPDPLGFAVVNINGDDCVLENLTVENTHGVIGKHAFAIYGKADRTVITDCNVYSQGNDTLSLWKGDTGRYYHARLKVRGSVDFICPRGWCYITDSEIYEVNPGASAAIWHDGSKDRDQKFVLRNCRFDGVEGWRLARHHADAQFYLLDCTFSAALLDLAPKRVIYPLGDKPITEAEVKRNRELDLINRWGERFYYHNVRRTGGDYAWHADNLATAEGSPKPEQITAKWTFAGTWDHENLAGPAITAIIREGGAVKVRFNENVTVKGRPSLILQSGSSAVYASGSGSDTLVFSGPVGENVTALRLELGGGAIIATEAHATLRHADLRLPSP